LSDDALRERLRAEQDERRRIAESLHDGPVQHVAALVQMLGALGRSLDDGDVAAARPVAARALEVARESATELREIVTGIEPALLDELGLAGALRELAERTAGRRGATLELELDAPTPERPGPGPAAASGLFQIAREAMEQAVRRGPPSHLRLVLRVGDGGAVTLVVADDAAPERRQAVLDSLAARAAELNAELVAERGHDRTIVRLVVPPSAAAL
jgi:signal transduction histidine kinase